MGPLPCNSVVPYHAGTSTRGWTKVMRRTGVRKCMYQHTFSDPCPSHHFHPYPSTVGYPSKAGVSSGNYTTENTCLGLLLKPSRRGKERIRGTGTVLKYLNICVAEIKFNVAEIADFRLSAPKRLARESRGVGGG